MALLPQTPVRDLDELARLEAEVAVA